MNALTGLFDKIVNPALLIRRLTVVAQHLMTEEQRASASEQMSLFGDDDAAQGVKPCRKNRAGKEKALQGGNRRDQEDVWKECHLARIEPP